MLIQIVRHRITTNSRVNRHNLSIDLNGLVSFFFNLKTKIHIHICNALKIIVVRLMALSVMILCGFSW